MRVRRYDPLRSAAGDVAQLSFGFSATAARRAEHSIVLFDERFEIAVHTGVGPAQGVPLVDPLPITVEIEDVSTFTRAVRDDEVPIVFIIRSVIAAEVDALYAGDTPLPKLRTTPLPAARPMWHPSMRRRFVQDPVVNLVPLPRSW
jgi:hypothetical protein